MRSPSASTYRLRKLAEAIPEAAPRLVNNDDPTALVITTGIDDRLSIDFASRVDPEHSLVADKPSLQMDPNHYNPKLYGLARPEQNAVARSFDDANNPADRGQQKGRTRSRGNHIGNSVPVDGQKLNEQRNEEIFCSHGFGSGYDEDNYAAPPVVLE